jgi:hypothetical protein
MIYIKFWITREGHSPFSFYKAPPLIGNEEIHNRSLLPMDVSFLSHSKQKKKGKYREKNNSEVEIKKSDDDRGEERIVE